MRSFLKASTAASALTAACLLLASPAAAAEGLVNGGFDTTLDPWTVSGGITVTRDIGPKALIGFNTSFAAASGTLSQTFTTTADGVFDYAFDAGRGEAFCGCGDAITFAAFLDGELLSDAIPAFSGGGVPQATLLASHYAGSVNLAAGDHTFSFEFSRFASGFGRAPYIVLDSVSGVLTPNAIDPDPGAGVPEPATWALMISGFGLAGAGLRRRRAALA